MSDHELTLAQCFANHTADELGFVGTRAGLTPKQHALLHHVVKAAHPVLVRHGANYGSDNMFHTVVGDVWPEVMRDVWPSDSKQFSFYRHQSSVHLHAPMDGATRTDEIVKRSKFLLTTPNRNTSASSTSQTWSAVAAARRLKIPILIVWPDGKMTLDHNQRLTRVIP